MKLSLNGELFFWINLVVMGSSGLVYVLFGSAEVQIWNYSEGEYSEEITTKETRHEDQTINSIPNQLIEVEEAI
ncbi:unnamed protein product [Larinioides sclopetarius]|uniref:Uncharacterized protein n=1 Tax=Larinioides sclopetarius TaxID=280406 RepID=A0AAV2BBA9_9ARAC